MNEKNTAVAAAGICGYFHEVSETLLKSDFDTLDSIAREIVTKKGSQNRIYTVGNGGSAATASHFANDLLKGCRMGDECGFRVVCLCDPLPIVTCLANDFSYEDVFSIMLDTYADPGDLLVVFSGSGNSENVLNACRMAHERGMKIIAFGGRDGGKMAGMCDISVIAPTQSMEQIEDLHMIYTHAIVCRIRELLAGSAGQK